MCVGETKELIHMCEGEQEMCVGGDKNINSYACGPRN